MNPAELQNDKPKPLTVKEAGLPRDFFSLPAVCAKCEPRPNGNGWKKTPYDPRTGTLAKPNDPATWASVAESLAAHKSGEYDYLWLVLTRGCGIVAIDIDHCRTVSSTRSYTHAWAKQIIADFDSYTEISPSGDGIHIFIRAEWKQERDFRKFFTDGGEIDVFGQGFISITGRRLQP